MCLQCFSDPVPFLRHTAPLSPLRRQWEIYSEKLSPSLAAMSQQPASHPVVLHNSPSLSHHGNSRASRSAVQDEYTYADDDEDITVPAAAAAPVPNAAAAAAAAAPNNNIVQIHPAQPADLEPPQLQQQSLGSVTYDPASATKAAADRDLEAGTDRSANHRRESLSIIVPGAPAAPIVAGISNADAAPTKPQTQGPMGTPNAKPALLAATGAAAAVDEPTEAVYPYGHHMTYFLILAYTILFIVEFGTAEEGWGMESWFVNPSGGPSYHQLDRLGGHISFKVLGKVNGSWGSLNGEAWRLITSIFWHSGILTFLYATAVTLWLGIRLEREYGPLRIVIIWVGSAFFGVIFSSIFVVDLLTVSGTAGCMGLIGARLVDMFLYRDWYVNNLRRCVGLLLVLLIGILLGLLPLVDNWAHLGALVMGALLAGVLCTGGWRSAPDLGSNTSNVNLHLENRTRRYTKTRITCIILVIACYAICLGVLFGAVRGGMTPRPDETYTKGVTNVWCQGCNQFQCMEAAPWTCRPLDFYD